ncbi:hypothetical protein ACOALA_20795 (plasmid) [Alicyclobacillus acidoterrestris]|uniref:hypothetical protein n=1 Tax=Alicyclobacillus acidoterrestris TaxID=1450 RepID=UPI003F53B98D
MAQKELWTPTEFVQLDLFEIADRNDWERESKASHIDPKDFRIGDIFYVKWGNGLDFEGRLAAKGWWCEREDLENYHWIDVGGRFRHFDPYLDEWMYKGHDNGYEPLSKTDITEKLMERLSTVPLKDRVEVFKAFEEEYPWLSAEYHPLVKSAWDKAIVAVSTLDEFLTARKDWSCPANIPPNLIKQVKKYVESVFWLPRELWRSELLKLRWTAGGKTDHYVQGFEQRDTTYWRPLYKKLLTECRTPDELFTFMVMRGSESFGWVFGKPSQARVWLEEKETLHLGDLM